MERWKTIDSLPGYSISDKGRVRKDETGQIMVLSKNGGYCRITISKHVHRLVAEAFIEKPSNDKCWVDHIDGNRSNNSVDNLRWVTPSENCTAYGYQQACAEYFGCSDSEIIYNKLYMKHSPQRRLNPNAHDKKGWMFEKVEDIV